MYAIQILKDWKWKLVSTNLLTEEDAENVLRHLRSNSTAEMFRIVFIRDGEYSL